METTHHSIFTTTECLLVSALAPDTKVYASAKAPATLDEMLWGLYFETGIRFPTSPLLYSDPYAYLTHNLQSAVVIETTKVDGTECYHLALRNTGANWEIWIDTDSNTLPYRMAVTFTDRPNFPRTMIEFFFTESLPVFPLLAVHLS